MENSELKTSMKQRIVIIAIAVVMLGSIIASYAAIIMSGNSNKGEGYNAAQIAAYQKDYEAAVAKFATATQDEFELFSQYQSEIKAYNEETANSNGVQVKDLYIGDGRELGQGDTDYMAFYVGWCADETIFDSSFDDANNPKMFTKALDASLGMIEGWNMGVAGMKIGGVRRITVPGELAYKDQLEICGGKNKPLRFLVMAVEPDDELAKLSEAVDMAYMQWQYALYLSTDGTGSAE